MNRLLYASWCFGMAVTLIGVLFRIQHWVQGRELLLAGKIFLALFFALAILEMLRSRKADTAQKITWTLVLTVSAGGILLLFNNILLLGGVAVLGNLYLHFIRRYFLYTRAELESIQFDSI